MSLKSRITEHIALMGRYVIGISGIGGVLGVIGAVQLIEHGAKHASGWLWLAGGLAVGFVAQIWAVQRALTERHAAVSALAAASQGSITGVAMQNVEAAPEGVRISGTHIVVGAGGPALHPSRRRLFPRILSEEERCDLARRCEECSHELLELLHEPHFSYASLSPAVIEAAQRERDKRREEAERRFETEFTVRIRDLMNECVEAGYALDKFSDGFRVGYPFPASVHEMRPAGEAIGILGRRVARRSKKL